MRNPAVSLFIVATSILVSLSGGAFASERATLYDKLGGEAGIAKIVDAFVVQIIADDRINFAFAGGDMSIFKQRLAQQFCDITNGPCKYTGKDMRTAHEKLKVTPAQFNALAEDLYVAMKQSHVPYRTQNKLMALLAPMEHDMVQPGLHLDHAPSDKDLTPVVPPKS
jgi:hemoglobin